MAIDWTRNFWGKGKRFVRAITSATLKARLKPDTLVGTMCCYGAQIFSPEAKQARNRGRWPLASTYLRKGALAFVGSTRQAWLGVNVMKSADWIVADYFKRILGGASIGRAFLESKQKYISYYIEKGRSLDAMGQKTLIEYVLLGDPSIHPVGRRVSDPERAIAAGERRQRRVVLARRPSRSANCFQNGWPPRPHNGPWRRRCLKAPDARFGNMTKRN